MPVLDYKGGIVVRAAAILTTSYVAGTVIGPSDPIVNQYTQLIIYADFTIGSLTDAQIKVEFSNDGTTYYQETFSSVSAGTDTNTVGVHKLTATGKYRIAVPIADRYIKISAIGTGTTTSSSLAIEAVLAVN